MPKPGRTFEIAVYDMVKALDASAEVIFDHKVPDRDVPETLRQVDVWINATVGGHWPISVLISCKDHKRRLNVGDIEKFLGEVRSTGASTGVIYSHSGFSKAALEKARVNGTSCCRLYQNAPADIPAILMFSSYLCAPSFQLVLPQESACGVPEIWNDIFDMPVKNGDATRSVLEVLGDAFRAAEASAKSAMKPSCFPSDMSIETWIVSQDDPALQFVIVVRLYWRRYRGRVDAHLLNGSYCFSNKHFHGAQTGPWIDMRGPHPGEGWAEIVDPARALPERCLLAILTGGNFEELARQTLGHQRRLVSPAS